MAAIAGSWGTMRAAVFHGRRDVRLERMPVPEPQLGEVRLRVTGVGICGTDVSEFVAGPAMFPIETAHAVSGHVGPMIPGHEFAGVVDALGEGVTAFAVGDRIFSPGTIACEECPACRSGRTNLCERYVSVGLHRHGALAEFVTVPARWCFALPQTIGDRVAPLAQPMAIAVHAMRRGRTEATAEAIVIGCGGIGAFLVYALTQAGVRVCAADPIEERRAVALHLGAHRAVPALIGDHAALVFEVSGTQGGLDAALSAVDAGGRIVTVGIMKGAAHYDARKATIREIELIGTNALVADVDVPQALELLAREPALWALVAPEAIALGRVVDDGLIPMAERRPTPVKILIDPRL